VEHYLQTYTEPSMINNNNNITVTASTSTSSVPSTIASSTPILNNVNISSTVDQQVMLPLSTGCLTNNLGLPITVVCCKVWRAEFVNDFYLLIRRTCRAMPSISWSKPMTTKMTTLITSSNRFDASA